MSVETQIEGPVAVLVINNPPVNALGFRTRRSLLTKLEEAKKNPQVKAIVLMGGGSTFPTGVDIREFNDPAALNAEPHIDALVAAVESSFKPVVAAMHGAALGGGLEIALGCHWRIAAHDAKLGLPEVNIGLLPGGGGTQRLPRLIGVAAALKLAVGGAPVSAQEALSLKLADIALHAPPPPLAAANATATATASATANTREHLRRFAVSFAAARAEGPGGGVAGRVTGLRSCVPTPAMDGGGGGGRRGGETGEAAAPRSYEAGASGLVTRRVQSVAASFEDAARRCKAAEDAQPPAEQGGLAKRLCARAVGAAVARCRAAHRAAATAEAQELFDEHPCHSNTAFSCSDAETDAVLLAEHPCLRNTVGAGAHAWVWVEALALGLADETELFDRLVMSPQACARRYLFFSERLAGRPSEAQLAAAAMKEAKAAAAAAAVAALGGSPTECAQSPSQAAAQVSARGAIAQLGRLGTATLEAGGGAAVRGGRGGGGTGGGGLVLGIVGGGTMGSGIALAALAATPGAVSRVVVVDTTAEGVGRSKAYVARGLKSLAKRGRMSGAEAEVASLETQGRLAYATDLGALADCDVVVEAVFEDLGVKRKVFEQLSELVKKPDALLASNTSTLDVDQIAAAAGPDRQGNVLGMHFFSPAHLMKLVEVVRGSSTSEASVAKVLALTKAMGKVGVVVGNCDGFVGNRVLDPYLYEASFLVEEGANPRQIDRALGKFGFGMAMGPMETTDLAGMDIGYSVRQARGLVKKPEERFQGGGGGGGGGPPGAPRYCELNDLLCEAGRLGHKSGKGWYDYPPAPAPLEGQETAGASAAASSSFAAFAAAGAATSSSSSSGGGQESPETLAIIGRYRSAKGVHPKHPDTFSDREIQQRCLFGLVNEAFKALEEGIAARPSDIDVIYAHGYGWPAWRGGPMFWAEHDIGLRPLLVALVAYSAQFPDVPHWVPSQLLRRLVDAKAPLRDFQRFLTNPSPPQMARL